MAEEKKEQKSSWSWKISGDELKKQIDNYGTLKITKSYRGISFLIIFVILALSVILAIFGVGDTSTILYSLIIYVPVLIFVYKGHRWAIIAMMVLWTLEKGVMLYDGGGIMQIIWWLIVMPFFWKALQVENERKKIGKNNLVSQTSNIFCSKCGVPIESDSKFCAKCGNKII